MSWTPAVCRTLVAMVVVLVCAPLRVLAHDGPPFPIVSDRTAGPYVVSIWTDPDSTDDGSAGGRFWVTLGPTSDGGHIPAGTAVTVSIAPADRPGRPLEARAEPVNGAVTNQLAALVMDHEGRFRVQVSVDGPLGRAHVDGEVDATYDLRPPPFMLVVYLIPFLLVAFLWIKLMLKRRGSPTARTAPEGR